LPFVIVHQRKTLAQRLVFPHLIAMQKKSRSARSTARLGLLALAIAVVGCGRASGEVREWQASDHDQPAGQQGQVPARPSSSGQAGSDKSLVELAWMKNCATCHGAVGRGDGPQGPMVRAQDLTRAEWQAQVTDEQIAEVIRKGRNRMPAFESLPPQVITGLVARIREHRAR